MQRYPYCFLILLLFSNIAWGELSFRRHFSLGGQFTAGNSEINSLNFDFLLNRNNKWIDELTVKGSFDQQATSGTATRFKVGSSIRYACSLTKQTYYYYMLEAEHDRFQDIDLRLLPTIGAGYWFADQAGFAAMIEGAIGYQRQQQLDNSVEENTILAAVSSLSWGSLANSFNLYVLSGDLSNYRFTNALNYHLKLNDHYAVKWALKDEYNSKPAGGVKKNDFSFITSIEYDFHQKIKQTTM